MSVQAEDVVNLAEEKPEEQLMDKTMRGVMNWVVYILYIYIHNVYFHKYISPTK